MIPFSGLFVKQDLWWEEQQKLKTSSPSLEWICFFKAGRDSSVVGNQSSPCPKMGPYMDVRMVHCKEGAEEIIFVTKGNFSYQIKFDRKFMLRVYIWDASVIVELN